MEGGKKSGRERGGEGTRYLSNTGKERKSREIMPQKRHVFSDYKYVHAHAPLLNTLLLVTILISNPSTGPTNQVPDRDERLLSTQNRALQAEGRNERVSTCFIFSCGSTNYISGRQEPVKRIDGGCK